MKKIILIGVLLCFSAYADEKCDASKPECLIAITHMDGSLQTLNNFYISSIVQLNSGYFAVILNNDGQEDESGLFLLDKDKKHYLTLDYLPSHRSHDYFYEITSHGKNYVIIKGTGGYGYSVEGEVKYEIDFKNGKKIKYKLESIHITSVYQNGEYIYFNLSGKGLKNKIIRFHEGNETNKKHYFSFVSLPTEEKNKFKKIKSYTKDEVGNKDKALLDISEKRIDHKGLPQPDFSEYKKYRKDDYDIELINAGISYIENKIGPYVIKNNKVIFGISFYDGEGSTGIGGVGFYNIDKRKYDIHYIDEIANQSIGKMFLYNNDLWCTLYQGGEGAKYYHGVMKYNIKTKKVKVYDVLGEVDAIVPWKDVVFINTKKGFYQIKDGIKKGFFGISSDGDYKLIF